MVGRIAVIVVALSLMSWTAVQADEVGGEDIQVPPPAMAPAPPPPPAPVTAAPPPWVEMQSTSIGAGIGVNWGEGTLLFEGQPYAFSVKGLSLGDLGVSKALAEGQVENLTNVDDFAGQYVALEAGAAAGVGASATTMRNQHGVVITLQSELAGAQLSLGPQGFSIDLK